jgi:ketosteroid isomerase-like protein
MLRAKRFPRACLRRVSSRDDKSLSRAEDMGSGDTPLSKRCRHGTKVLPHPDALMQTASRIPLRDARRWSLVLLAPLLLACSQGTPASSVSPAQASAIADTLRGLVRNAYDLSKGDVVKRMMSVYPSSGRVVSATGGRITTSRDSLQQAITSFWENVGQHMVQPTWTWGPMEVDVLSPHNAVMSASYSVPHWTDAGRPHVIGGVWTTTWTRDASGWHIVHEHLSDLPRAVAERIEATMTPKDSAQVESAMRAELHKH